MENINVNRKNKATRIMAIDYLKAIAIVLVILTHILSIDQRLKVGSPYWINMAVPIFMIMSGFTHYMSAERRNMGDLRDYYEKEVLMPKLARILLPYFFIIAIEILLVFIMPSKFPELAGGIRPPENYLRFFLRGGRGPGSYYIPMMLQLTLIFPPMLVLFKRSPYKATGLFFSLHLAFDIISNYLAIPKGAYRLLIFRYLAFIVMGMILYKNRGEIKRKSLALFLSLLSIIYIYITNYYKYIPKVFSKWTRTSLPTVFWAFLLVALGMKYLEIKNKNIVTHTASIVGKASYHIFLIQKLFFRFRIKNIFVNINIVLKTLVTLVICSSLGIAFYYLDIGVRRKVDSKILK